MAEANSTCVVASCERPIQNKTLGYCDPHYKRHWRHGDVQADIPIPTPRRAPIPPTDHDDGTRDCQQCGDRKALTDFHRDDKSPLGRKTVCRACRSSAERARHHLRRDHNLERNKAYRVANLEALRAREAEAYERNKTARVAAATAQAHIRRARIANGQYERGVTVLALRKRDGDLCHYCQQETVIGRFPKGERPDNMATLEHLLPISRGGSHTFANCVVACWRCNITKGNRTVEEFRTSMQTPPRTPPK